MKMRPFRTDLFHSERQTDRHVTLMAAFRNFDKEHTATHGICISWTLIVILCGHGCVRVCVCTYACQPE